METFEQLQKVVIRKTKLWLRCRKMAKPVEKTIHCEIHHQQFPYNILMLHVPKDNWKIIQNNEAEHQQLAWSLS